MLIGLTYGISTNRSLVGLNLMELRRERFLVTPRGQDLIRDSLLKRRAHRPLVLQKCCKLVNRS